MKATIWWALLLALPCLLPAQQPSLDLQPRWAVGDSQFFEISQVRRTGLQTLNREHDQAAALLRIDVLERNEVESRFRLTVMDAHHMATLDSTISMPLQLQGWIPGLSVTYTVNHRGNSPEIRDKGRLHYDYLRHFLTLARADSAPFTSPDSINHPNRPGLHDLSPYFATSEYAYQTWLGNLSLLHSTFGLGFSAKVPVIREAKAQSTRQPNPRFPARLDWSLASSAPLFVVGTTQSELDPMQAGAYFSTQDFFLRGRVPPAIPGGCTTRDTVLCEFDTDAGWPAFTELRRAGNTDNKQFHAVLTIRSVSPDYTLKGSDELVDEAFYLLDQGRHKEAILLFERVPEWDQNPVTLFGMARAYHQSYFNEKALELMRKCILYGPGMPDAYRLRGNIYLELNNTDQALRDFTRAIELNDSAVPPYLDRARLYVTEGETEKGLADGRMAISLEPENGFCYFKMGQLYKLLDQYDLANEFYEQAVQRDSSLATAVMFDQASILARTGSWQEGYEKISLLLEIEPGRLDALNFAAYCLLELQQYDESMKVFRRIIELDPRHPLAYNNIGYIYFRLGDNKAALENIDLAISIHPANPYAYRNKALIYLDQQQPGLACEMIQQALELNYTIHYGPEMEELRDKHCK